MDRRSTPTTFPQGHASKPGRKSAFVKCALILGLTTAALAAAQTRVIIALPGGASEVEKLAADELAVHPHALYPSTTFETGAPVAAVPVIYLGTPQDLPESYASQVRSKLDNPESFVVETIGSGTGNVATRQQHPLRRSKCGQATEKSASRFLRFWLNPRL